MKKRFLVAGSITAVTFVLFLLAWIFQPDLGVFKPAAASRYTVDLSRDIILDLEGATVSVIEWGRDYVEISYDTFAGRKEEPVIHKKGNTLTLEPGLNFQGANHINLNVPKAAICLSAGNIHSRGGIFKSVKAEYASLQYCSFVDGFSSEGGELDIRNGKLEGKSRMKNETVNLRECDIGGVTLSPVAAGKGIAANLRELNGITVNLDAAESGNLSVLLRDSDLELLTVDYEEENGDITILSGRIKEIRNHSPLEIRYKKSALG